MLEDLEILALGELNLKPEEFGRYTIKELEAMLEGYQRRRERLEDLFIVYCALPTYRGAYGRKAPNFQKLTEHRRHDKRLPGIDEAKLKVWRNIQEVIKNEQKA